MFPKYRPWSHVDRQILSNDDQSCTLQQCGHVCDIGDIKDVELRPPTLSIRHKQKVDMGWDFFPWKDHIYCARIAKTADTQDLHVSTQHLFE